jgi:(p)ppGpp synthase/HD superfamily hydrolase
MDLQTPSQQGERMSEAFDDLPLAREALAFARAHHEGQRRESDDQPYVVHPTEVATMLRDAGYPDHVIAAGALHDVIEDTDADSLELRERFGIEVADLVERLTDDPEIDDPQERRAALREQVAGAGPEAAAVFAADKISKAREMRVKAGRGELGEKDLAKVEHYAASLELLTDLMPGHTLVNMLSDELVALRTLI